MGQSADRWTGAFFLLFGLAMYFMVIPAFVEVTDEGNIAPSTMPNWLSIIIALSGAALIVKPTHHQTQNLKSFEITGAYVAVLVIGVFAMSYLGFVYVGPVLALAIMLMIGERRLLWLFAGTVIMPASIWFFVEHMIHRVLP